MAMRSPKSGCLYCKSPSYCEAEFVHAGQEYACTREARHEGDHVACGTFVHNVMRWPNRSTSSENAAR